MTRKSKTGAHTPMDKFPGNPIQLPANASNTKGVSADTLHAEWEAAISGKTGKAGKVGKVGNKGYYNGNDYGNYTAQAYAPMCYESHPALPLGNGLVIYGGSCLHPIVADADVYVGLDSGMRVSDRALPWADKPTIEFLYRITDMSIPSDPVAFVKLIDWLAEQVMLGKKVHVGCIGGHGRTGMVFAALVKVMLGEDDAIAYVRKNYCKKGVETTEQIKFLMDLFGIKTATPSKAHAPYVAGTSGKTSGSTVMGNQFPAVQASFCLWGPKSLLK